MTLAIHSSSTSQQRVRTRVLVSLVLLRYVNQAEDYRYQIATITDKNKQELNTKGSIQHSYQTEYKEDCDVLLETYDNTKTSFVTTKGAYENEIKGDYFVKSDLPNAKIDDHVNTVDVIKTK